MPTFFRKKMLMAPLNDIQEKISKNFRFLGEQNRFSFHLPFTHCFLFWNYLQKHIQLTREYATKKLLATYLLHG